MTSGPTLRGPCDPVETGQGQTRNEDAHRLAAAIQSLGHRLLERDTLPRGNLCLSPASIALCASMALLGAKGETARELADLLGLVDEDGRPWARERLAKALAVVLEEQEPGGSAELRLVNDMWGQEGFAFRHAYLQTLRRAGSGLHEVDFRGQPESARRAINGHVANLTKDRIQELLPGGAVTSDTALVLTNAVYFKAKWANPFSISTTAPGPFRLTPGERVEVPVMRQVDTFGYIGDERLQMLVMHYDDAKDLEMVVMLPAEGQDLSVAYERLAPEAFAPWRAAVKYRTVDVRLPKVELRSGAGLVETLRAMGVRRAFDPELADFSAIHDSSDPLWVDAVLHRTFLRVDEEGSEAAAATGMTMLTGSAAPSEPIRFHVDRPYLMVIRNRTTGLLLFEARVVDPRP